MGYILDLIVVAILVVAVIISAKRGFMRTTIELVGFVLAVYLAFNFGPVLASGTYDKVIEPAVTKKVSDSISGTITESAEQAEESIWSALPSFVKNNAEKFGISKDSMSDSLSQRSGDNASQVASGISASVVKPIALTGLKILYGMIIFVVIVFLTKILARPINKLFSISVAGRLNKLLGSVFGLGKGVIYAIVFCAVVSTVIVLTKSGFLIFTADNINQSHLFKFLCELNPVY